MKRLILFAVLALSGCSTQPAATNEAAAANDSQPLAPAPPAADVAIADKTETFDYAYGWPGAAASVPFVNAEFEAEAARLKDEGLKAAVTDQQEMLKNGWPYRQHSFSKRWAVRGESPGLLSLGAEFDTYTGGAHGMQGFDARLVDRALGRVIPIRDLFVNPDRALAAMTTPFCATLDTQRAEKRGAPVTRDGDAFNACPKIAEQTIVPTGKGALDTFLVQVGPYEAGPYAEGDYQVPVPVTPALLAEIKPEYRGSFAGK